MKVCWQRNNGAEELLYRNNTRLLHKEVKDENVIRYQKMLLFPESRFLSEKNASVCRLCRPSFLMDGFLYRVRFGSAGHIWQVRAKWPRIIPRLAFGL